MFYIFLLTHHIKLKFWGLEQFHPGSNLGTSIQLCPSFLPLNVIFATFYLVFMWKPFVSRALSLLNPGLVHPFLNLSIAVGYCIPLQNLYALAVQKFQAYCVLRWSAVLSISDKNQKKIRFESEDNWHSTAFLFKNVDLNHYIHL